MRMTLAVAVAVLLFASVARADGIYVDGLVIPDGSTVTSIVSEGPHPNDFTVSFSFADGTGEVSGSQFDGEGGFLSFTNPVSNVSFDWAGYFFSANDNVGDNFSSYPLVNESNGTLEFAGPGITQIDFGSSDQAGGITSITYTPANVPEPSSLLLLGMGVAGILLWRERVPKIDVRGL